MSLKIRVETMSLPGLFLYFCSFQDLIRESINKVEVAIEKLILNINLVHLLDEMVEDFIYWEAIRYHC